MLLYLLSVWALSVKGVGEYVDKRILWRQGWVE